MFKHLFKRKKNRKADFKHAGHDFFVIPTKNLPYVRKSGYVIAMQEVEWKIVGEDLDRAIELLRENLRNGDISRAGYVLETLASFREQYVTWKTMFKLGNQFILIDDEKLGEFSDVHTKLKYDLCEKHDAVKDFFLTNALEQLKSFNTTLNISQIKDYLKAKQSRAIEARFSTAIR